MKEYINEIRTLTTSIEFAIMPDGDSNYKPPIMEIQNSLFLIREKTKKLEAELINNYGPR